MERVELELKRTFDWIIGPPKKSFNSNDGEKLEQKYFTIEPSKKYILVLSTFYRSHVLSHPHALALMKTLKDMHATSHISTQMQPTR